MSDRRDDTLRCDVLVVGSGAGGLAAAVTAAFHGLKVIVAEKAPVIGGTTAWSGGWLWIPRNPLAIEAGINEPPEEPRNYLRSEIGNRVEDPRIDAFLENGPLMVSFFRNHTVMEWVAGNVIPDFHATVGAAKGGRSVTAAPFDGRKLGAWANKIRPPLDIVSLAGMGIASGADITHFFNATRKLASFFHVTRRLSRHALDLVLHGRSTQLVNGNALIARLLRSALDLGVDIRTDMPVTGLIEDCGSIIGANCGDIQIFASRGVVLASGGFPHDTARIAQLFDHAPDGRSHFSAAPNSNTGDGLSLGETAGGTVAGDLAEPGAWAPVSLVPRKDGTTGHFPHLLERAKPGFIAVDREGKRFVNEADSYHDFMRALFKSDPQNRTPHAWLIADQRAQRRFGLGWSKPFPFPLRPYRACGYLVSAPDIATLAKKIAVPEDGLIATIARFNEFAAKGEDPDFGRGRSPYNRIQGDAFHAPNPSLAPLQNGPFHAVKIVPGSLGTFAGLRTDERARVLGKDSKPVPGLFAVGNDMASIFGGHYPSGGITLGPAMTFGYIAGRTLADIGTNPVKSMQEKSDEQLL